MTFKLKFIPAALKEWKKLDPDIQQRFKKHLKKRLENPYSNNDLLSGDLKNCYKIKLRSLGYRLVYQVTEKEKSLTVMAVGKRDKSMIYLHAKKRI